VEGSTEKKPVWKLVRKCSYKKGLRFWRESILVQTYMRSSFKALAEIHAGEMKRKGGDRFPA
jgi:hypothetical protein